MHAYTPATLQTVDLKTALSDITDAEPQPCDQEFLEILKHNMQFEIPFHSEIISRPSVSFQVLQGYSILKEATYIEHSNTNQLSYLFANNVLNEEDKAYALDRLNTLYHGSEKCQPPKTVILT